MSINFQNWSQKGSTLLTMMVLLTIAASGFSYIVKKNIDLQKNIKIAEISEEADQLFEYIHLSLTDQMNCKEELTSVAHNGVELSKNVFKIMHQDNSNSYSLKTNTAYGNIVIKEIKLKTPVQPTSANGIKYQPVATLGYVGNAASMGYKLDQIAYSSGKLTIKIEATDSAIKNFDGRHFSKTYEIPLNFLYARNLETGVFEFNKCYASDVAYDDTSSTKPVEDFCIAQGGVVSDPINESPGKRPSLCTSTSAMNTILALEGTNSNSVCLKDYQNLHSKGESIANVTKFCHTPRLSGCLVSTQVGPKAYTYGQLVIDIPNGTELKGNLCSEISGELFQPDPAEVDLEAASIGYPSTMINAIGDVLTLGSVFSSCDYTEFGLGVQCSRNSLQETINFGEYHLNVDSILYGAANSVPAVMGEKFVSINCRCREHHAKTKYCGIGPFKVKCCCPNIRPPESNCESDTRFSSCPPLDTLSVYGLLIGTGAGSYLR